MLTVIKFFGRNILTIAVLAIGIILGGYLIGAAHNVRDFFFPPTDVTVSRPVIVVKQTRAIAELVTVSSEIGTTDIDVEIHQGFLNAGYYSASHIAIGAVDAGINFEKFTEDAIELRDDTYTIKLPAPEITSCRIEYIDQNQHSLTLLSADWDMVRQIAHAEAIDGFARDMIEEGILERAAEEAEFRIGEFILNLTGLNSTFEFDAASGNSELPDSCKPVPPSGWAKDTDGAWKQTS
ncbi:MAG: DUF4230 domain-containing protein [Chloroflexi bacterium]|nr:DUF4230 domain-containing protein [Chloroflexota bacterium]